MSSEVHGLHPDMPFREAAKPVIGQKLDEMFKFEAGTREGTDSEELHDMRVASRRLREAMTIFAVCYPASAYKPLQRMARSLTRALGEVRDRDVLLETLGRYAKKAPSEEHAGIDDIVRVIRNERELHRASMLHTLDVVDNAGFQHVLHVVLMQDPHAGARHAKKAALDPQATLQENAQIICVERAATLYGYVPFIRDPANEAELHEMRIAAKHLRYALEIFKVCFSQDIDERIEDIKEVQEQIGTIHDCDVLIALVRQHLSVVAQRIHEDLVARATQPLPHNDRLASVNDLLQQQIALDPRPGLLSLLSRKTDERNRRYAEFIGWWDEQQQANMRGTLYSCIAAVNRPEAQTEVP